MSTRMDEKWETVRFALKVAQGIAFDGCHKIYILLDEEQMAEMRSYGYHEDGSSLHYIDHLDAGNPDRSRARLEQVAYDILRGWYDTSCGLRFINAVQTNHADPNAGFTSLIDQFEEEEEDQDVYGWGTYDGEEDYR